jgi:ABC-type multidrug transport system permease subunit
MRSFLHLLRSELRRLGKTPSVPLLWLSFPLVLSLIEYAAFGQIGRGSTGMPKGTLLLVDEDRSIVSSFLGGALEREPLADFFDVVKVDTTAVLEKMLADNEGSAALVVPAGFADSILQGAPVELLYTPNPRQLIRPQMIDAALRTFLEIGNRFLHEADTAIDELRVFVDADSTPPRDMVLRLAGSFYDAGRRFEKLGTLGDLDVKVERRRPKEAGAAPAAKINFFAYFLPGLSLFSLLLIGQGFEGRFFAARLRGITRRVAASPVSRLTALLAESAGIYLGTLASGVIILGIGVLVFRIEMRQPLVVVMTLLGFGVFVVGLVKTLYGRARNKRSAEMVSSVVVLLTTLVGGGLAPVEMYSEAVRPLALATPVGCASQAMLDVLVHGRGLAAAGPHVLGIWAWGVAFCVSGFLVSWRARGQA